MPDNPITTSDTTVVFRVGYFGVGSDCQRDDTTKLSVVAGSTAYGDQIRTFPEFLDADHSRWVEVELAADANDTPSVSRGWLRVYRREGGSDELIEEVEVAGLLPGVQLTIVACIDAVGVLASVNGARLDVVAEELSFAPDPTPGSLTAVGTGTISGDVTFYSAAVSHKTYEVECDDCSIPVECGLCEDGLRPSMIQVAVHDLVNKDCDCESLNGTHILSADTLLHGTSCLSFEEDLEPLGGSERCGWSKFIGQSCPSPPAPLQDWIHVFLAKHSDGYYWFVAELRTEFGPFGANEQQWAARSSWLIAEGLPDCIDDFPTSLRLDEIPACPLQSIFGPCDYTASFLTIGRL